MDEAIRVLTELAEELEAEAARWRSPLNGHVYNAFAARAVRDKIRALQLVCDTT